MRYLDDRRHRLLLALVVFTLVTLYVIWQVVWTVFFALTFAYVLYPTRRELVNHGMRPRMAAGVLTLVAFGSVLALFAPVLVVLYQRRDAIIEFLRNIPQSIDVVVGGFTYSLELQSLVPVVRGTLSAWGVAATSAAPIVAMKIFLFLFLVYAILYRPGSVRTLVFRAVDGDVQTELTAYHERIRDTLYGLYFVQAATGVLTFLVALPVFALLGYGAFFSLAVIAGILQFIPVLGPSVLIAALAIVEIVNPTGSLVQATLVLVIGLALIGFLPDAVLRPRLAQFSAGMPASLYFIGFLGGILTVGPIGIIAGPLALSVLVETVELIADGFDAERGQRADAAAGVADLDDDRDPESARLPEDGEADGAPED